MARMLEDWERAVSEAWSQGAILFDHGYPEGAKVLVREEWREREGRVMMIADHVVPNDCPARTAILRAFIRGAAGEGPEVPKQERDRANGLPEVTA